MNDVDVLKLARFMFDFEVSSYVDAYGETPQEVEDAWNDSGIRQFWIVRAEAFLSFLGYAGVEG